MLRFLVLHSILLEQWPSVMHFVYSDCFSQAAVAPICGEMDRFLQVLSELNLVTS